MARPSRMQGTIKSLKREAGYGFIIHRETGVDHFFHRTEVARDLWEDLKIQQLVEFTSVEGPHGRHRAIDVRVVQQHG